MIASIHTHPVEMPSPEWGEIWQVFRGFYDANIIEIKLLLRPGHKLNDVTIQLLAKHSTSGAYIPVFLELSEVTLSRVILDWSVDWGCVRHEVKAIRFRDQLFLELGDCYEGFEPEAGIFESDLFFVAQSGVCTLGLTPETP